MQYERRNTGKVAAVKKITCYLLIAWLTLMSGGVNAHVHAYEHHSHQVDQTHDDYLGHDHHLDRDLEIDSVNGSKAASSEFAYGGDDLQANLDNAEKVNEAHFSHAHNHSHSHCAYMPTSCNTLAVIDMPGFTSFLCQQWVCKTIANNIERPKWLLTTHAVVNLLG